ncbi:MAG TPA: ABC transporter ATP-binding protein [Stellaceae bacterium]|nr:ABC transporter ATP-binding protein [Stellaceae bacterium]
MTPRMLDIAGLEVRYDQVEALRGVDLAVRRGEIVAIIGANGAGKSTLLRAISGLVRPTRGHIAYQDEEIAGLRPDRIVSRGLVHCPEGRAILKRMTVRENLRLGAYRLGERNDRTLDKVFALFPRLQERQHQLGASLSGGEQQMLAIGRALMSEPSLLLLDEPSLGLAPLMVAETFRIVRELRTLGVTVLLVEQNAAQALRCADRAYVLENGRITLAGPAAALLDDSRVRDAYLGAGAAGGGSREISA